MELDRRALLIGGGAVLATPLWAHARPRGAVQLIAAARRQVGVTRAYDPAYTRIPFPNGDVRREIGVCTDVVIRAYRDAFGIDLQALVNADMRAAFSAYPRNWGLRGTDSSIDHRRVPNLRMFLSRKRAERPLPADPSGWRPGDIFTSLIGRRLPHIGIVSDRHGPSGWLVIHNIGAGTREEDALNAHPLTGRYRFAIT